MNRKRRVNGVVVRVPKRILIGRGDWNLRCRTWPQWWVDRRLSEVEEARAAGLMSEDKALMERFKAIFLDVPGGGFVADFVRYGEAERAIWAGTYVQPAWKSWEEVA